MTNIKQLVKDAAIRLMELNGTTTTLEVKNNVHATWLESEPCELRQSQTSDLMAEIAKEENWERRTTREPSTGAVHLVYSVTAVIAAAQTLPKWPTQLVPTTTQTNPATNLVAAPKVHITDPAVAYVTKQPNLYATGKDFNEARRNVRKLYKGIVNASNSNLNRCSAEHFMKYHMA